MLKTLGEFFMELGPGKPNHYNNNNSTLYESIQTAIFFDNDAHKIEEVTAMCGNIIEGISVPESPNGAFTVPLTQIKDFLKDSPKAMKYLDFLNIAFKQYSLNSVDNFDKVSGIQQEHIDKATEWLERTKEIKQRAAIFDWDRTITMFEGIFPAYDPRFFSFEDWLCYLCGGDARFELLRDFLRTLHENNVEIIILTNNGSCNHPKEPTYAAIFKNLVHTLLQDIPYTLICSKYTAAGHKGVAIKADPRFSKCAVKGGRRKKTKKNNKRKTKRRG
jgi:hypothetical protein